LHSFRKNILKLLPILAIVLLAGLVLSRVWSPETKQTPAITITVFEASDHIGNMAEVCGFVSSAVYLQQVRGRPTFLNFERPYPNQVFTAVIWGDNRSLWSTPPEFIYDQERVCVTGRITSHEGVPQIIMRNPDSIRIE
jgi:hypothetical protein